VEDWLALLTRYRILWLMLAGALGTYARFELTRWIHAHEWAAHFPYATLFINVSGSFLLGLIFVIVYERLPPHQADWYVPLGVGFCGGYTTFSTFEVETYKLVRTGHWGLALTYVGASVVAGFFGVLLAVVLVNGVWPRR